MPRVGYLCAAPRVSRGPDAEGGPRSHVDGVLKGFTAAGWGTTTFLAGDHLPSRARAAARQPAAPPSRPSVLAADAARLLATPALRRAAVRHVGRPDVVYERLAAFSTLGPAFRRRGIPWILETNAVLHREAPAERGSLALVGLARRLEIAAYRDADLVVCVSPALRDQVVELASIPAERCLVVPNAVDPDRFDPAAVPDGRRRDRFTVGYAGKLTDAQGVDVLLDAVASAAREVADLQVVVAGGGPASAHLQARASALGIAGRVQFTGWLEPAEVIAQIARFDVAYLGHRPFGGRHHRSPLKLYEYLAMARPVVATRFPETEAILGASGAGWLVRPDDPEATAAAIVEAARRRHQLPSMGAAGRAHVMAGHSWSHRVERLLDRLTELRLLPQQSAPPLLVPLPAAGPPSPP